MKIVVIGGHGKIARRLHPLLIERGHQVAGLIRRAEHVGALEQMGVQPVVCDMEQETRLDTAIGAADVIVFAAGAGPGSGAARKWAVDRDGALKAIEAAQRNGIARYIMVSAMNTRTPRGNEVFRAYLQAKAQADDALVESGLAYTIVRPGRLLDDPGHGRVAMAPSLPSGEIPRDDVAQVVAEVIDRPATAGLAFDLTSGPLPIPQALDALLSGE